MQSLLLYLSFFLLPFNHADVKPQFKGGEGSLDVFITSHLVYPEFSSHNCISGTIQVSFFVGKDGKVFNVKVHKGLGIDLDDEAVRVVKLTSGKWIIPPGYDLPQEMIIPITFRTELTRCQYFNQSQADLAIEAYKQQQAVSQAVTNYYANKYSGKADTTKEDLVRQLKAQLGYDDDYVTDMLDQANKKFKQGDHEGACHDWLFIRNIGSNKADAMLAKYCR